MTERVRTYDTFEDLGRAVMAINPAIPDTTDPRRVGMRVYEKFPGRAKVVEAESSPSPRATTPQATTSRDVVNRLLGQQARGPSPQSPMEFVQGLGLPSVPSPVDVAQRIGQAMGPLQEGIVSGMTMGATKTAGRMIGQPPPEGSMLYGAGEFVGEIVGPYSWARKILGPVHAAAAASRFPAMAQAAVSGGLEGAMVETSKSLLTGDVGEAIERGATALVLDTAMEGAVRGVAGAGRAGAAYLLRPSPGEVDTKLLSFMQRWELPTIPSLVRPFSNLTRQVQRRLTHTATTASTFQAARKQFMLGMGNFRNDVVARMGDNAALRSPSEVGHAISDAIDATSEGLRKTRKEAYEGIIATGVSREPISGTREFTYTVLPEGADPVQVKTNLLDGLRRTLGDRILTEEPKNLGPVQRKLRNIYESIAAAHRPPGTKAGQVIEGIDVSSGGAVIGTPGPTAPRTKGATGAWAAVGGAPPAAKPTLPRSETAAGGSERIATSAYGATSATPPTPEQSYQWWWNKNQTVGDLFQRRDVKENQKLRRLVASFYQTLQDGIDSQAASRHPDYEPAITMARALHSNYMEFTQNDVVRRVRDMVRKGDAPLVVRRLLDSPDDIRSLKRVLGPEAFNSLRQGWVRDFLDDSIKRDASTAEQYLNAGRFLDKLDKRGGLDGEFFGELFGDQGFVDLATGEAVQVVTHGPEKLAQLRELIDISERLAPAQATLKAGSEEMGGTMVERVTPATFVAAVTNSPMYLKGLLANIFLLRKGAELYLAEPSRNPFLGAAMPQIGRMDIPLPFMRNRLPRTEMTNAIANRLMGEVGGE